MACAAANEQVIEEADAAVIHAQDLLNTCAAENAHLTKCNKLMAGSIRALNEECLLQRRQIAALRKLIKAHQNAMRVVGAKLAARGAAGKRR